MPSVAASTSTSTPARHRSPKPKRASHPGSCPNAGSVLGGVYHPDRLRVIDPCRHVTGTVTVTRGEEDGDLHFDVRLDGSSGMLMANNYSEQHGALVVELMPRDHGHLPSVQVGDHVSITGAYVDDTQHDWAEIHPVWSLAINGGPTYRSGPQYGGSPPWAGSVNAVDPCHINGDGDCVAYSGAGSPTPSQSGGGSSSTGGGSSGSGSSSSAGQIVHPGAFCSPEGAHGVTSRGTPMTCKTSAADSRARWRKS